jgi:hypothetical protein
VARVEPALPVSMASADHAHAITGAVPPRSAAATLAAAPVPQVGDPAMPADLAFTRPVQPDANPAVAAVARAHRSGKDLQALSPLSEVPDFSWATYCLDPAAYCALSIPGRAYQSAQPGPDVPPLRYAGGTDLTVPMGGTCRLGALTIPHAPVSALAFGLGAFANDLTAITVQADERGEAWIEYHATAGTVGAVTVLVASPVASGQLSFQITVEVRNDQTALR